MVTNNNLEFEKKLNELTPLIRDFASNFVNPNITAEELFQEGMLGVYKAYQKFDPGKGTKFSTYAYYWIKKYIMKYIENKKSDEKFNERLFDDNIEDKHIENLSEEVTFPEKMPDQEKQILNLLFNEKKTLNEISIIMKIPREKIRQIKEKGLRRLRIK